MINVTVSVTPHQAEEQPTFAQVLHCSQTPYTGYRRYMTWRDFVETTGKGDPSVFKYINRGGLVYLTKLYQEWIFGLFREASEGQMTEAQLKTAWTNATAWNKAFNNKRGREQGFADYILHVNENAKQGLGCEGVMCTGATIKLIDQPYLGREYSKPVWFQDFEVIDVLKVPDPKAAGITWATHWWLIMPATNSLNLDGGKERIDPFPKMAGDRDTPWPLMGYGTSRGTIQRDWLKILPKGIKKPAYPYTPFRNKAGVNRFEVY